MANNIFSSVSLTFSFSLAFITWVILCYFKLIEDQFRANEKNVQARKENAVLAINPPPKCPDSSTDLYASFLWIFVCVCALTKLIQCMEQCIGKGMQLHQFGMDGPIMNNNGCQTNTAAATQPVKLMVTPQTMQQKTSTQQSSEEEKLEENAKDGYELKPDMTKDKEVDHMEQLEMRCLHMQKILEELQTSSRLQQQDRMEIIKQSNFHTVAVPTGSSNITKQKSLSSTLPPPSAAPNVFISHNHFHLTGPVFLNQRTVNIQMQHPYLAFFGRPSGNEFRQVWSKCIRGREQRNPIVCTIMGKDR